MWTAHGLYLSLCFIVWALASALPCTAGVSRPALPARAHTYGPTSAAPTAPRSFIQPVLWPGMTKAEFADSRQPYRALRQLRIFQCAKPSCSLTFLDVKQLRKHADSFGHDNPQPHVCPLIDCQKRFEKLVGFDFHLSEHSSRPHNWCGTCSTKCRDNAERRLHCCRSSVDSNSRSERMAVLVQPPHGAAMPVDSRMQHCNLCGLSTLDADMMHTHKANKHRRGKYKCTVCPRTFHENWMIQNHLADHNSNKQPMTCRCGDVFFRWDDWRQHVDEDFCPLGPLPSLPKDIRQGARQIKATPSSALGQYNVNMVEANGGCTGETCHDGSVKKQKIAHSPEQESWMHMVEWPTEHA